MKSRIFWPGWLAYIVCIVLPIIVTIVGTIATWPIITNPYSLMLGPPWTAVLEGFIVVFIFTNYIAYRLAFPFFLSISDSKLCSYSLRGKQCVSLDKVKSLHVQDPSIKDKIGFIVFSFKDIENMADLKEDEFFMVFGLTDTSYKKILSYLLDKIDVPVYYYHSADIRIYKEIYVKRGY